MKTIGYYMRMMNNAEKETEAEEKEVQEGVTCSCGNDKENCNCPSECGCNAIKESHVEVSGTELDLTPSKDFVKFVQYNIKELEDVIRAGINRHIDVEDSYTCHDYLIIGTTLEQGVIAILKCVNEYGEEVNIHIESKNGNVDFKGTV